MGEAQYKGVGFINSVAAVKALCSAARFTEFAAALPDHSRALLASPPPASAWIPLAHARDLVETAARVAFLGDLTQIREVGRRSQADGIRTVHKLFVRMLRPDHVIGRASQVWHTYYQGNGSARVERLGERSIDLLLEGVVIPSPEYWEMMAGVCVAFGEATHVRGLEVGIAGGGGQENHCRIRVVWR